MDCDCHAGDDRYSRRHHSANRPPTPAPPIPVNQNSTPHGYTFSLLLFIVPTCSSPAGSCPARDCTSPSELSLDPRHPGPAGFSAGFLLRPVVLRLSQRGATLGWRAPALGRPVPVEEYVFYLTGFLAVLLLYIWLGEFWLAAYNVLDYPGEAKQVRRLLQFHPTSLILAVVLIGAAWYYKNILLFPKIRRVFPVTSRSWSPGLFFPP